MRRFTLLLLPLTAACASLENTAAHRQVGASLQHLANDTRQVMWAPGGLARLSFLTGRPMLVDFRNAVARLPSTLRIDRPLLPDHHTAVRAAAGSRGAWHAPGLLARALWRLLP